MLKIKLMKKKGFMILSTLLVSLLLTACVEDNSKQADETISNSEVNQSDAVETTEPTDINETDETNSSSEPVVDSNESDEDNNISSDEDNNISSDENDTTTSSESNTNETVSTDTTDSIDTTKTTVNLDIKDLNITNLEKYTIASTKNEIVATSNDKLLLSKDEKDVVSLMDNGGQPVLMGRKYVGDSSVDISLESSAELFVLYAPRFNGVVTTDPKKLSEEIRTNKNFPQLVEAIKKAINTNNPCPLDPMCNYKAKKISLTIADELEIDDLYEGGN